MQRIDSFSTTTGPTWIDRRFDNPALRFGSLGSVEVPNARILDPKRITVEAKFGGDIDEVRIWNRALTPAEIQLRERGY